MLRTMVFVDHYNFSLALKQLYSGEPSPKLDYRKVFKSIVSLCGEKFEFVKTIIFDSKPDEFLMKDEQLIKYYNWVNSLKNIYFTDVIFGRYVARPIEDKQIDILDKSTYYKIEKGTDINIATNLLIKAYNNSFDAVVVMSADTDYLSVYKQLKNMGKIVIIAVVCGQYIEKIRDSSDRIIYLDKNFFDNNQRMEN